MRRINLAIVGATGLVGQEVLKILKERDIPVNRLKLAASDRSLGKEVIFKDVRYRVVEIDKSLFEGMDFAIFSAGKGISLQYASIAAKVGTVVIDNSNAFRMDRSVPLVIPEINPQDLKNHDNIIANPNCSTIGMLMPLFPIYKRYGIETIVVSTYQAMSGAGKDFLDKYERESRGEIKDNYPIYDNVIPQIDLFEKNGYTVEEMKMLRETRKILHDKSIKVDATCVRVPVVRAHGESCFIKLKRKFEIPDIRTMLNEVPGVKVVDNIENLKYPTPSSVSGRDDVYVGRIRRSNIDDMALDMWIVSDNLRKGAALNAVQILEGLL
ncbi:MAG: aspartate-semialdehyde dehydrogenase [Proteobacteria bacterium]|nr:aspartate-semialdehyde dehydrogenase [Pseudomonadota bacterium]